MGRYVQRLLDSRRHRFRRLFGTIPHSPMWHHLFTNGTYDHLITSLNSKVNFLVIFVFDGMCMNLS